MWLQRVKEELGPRLVVGWRYFSIEQANNPHGPGWRLWEQPLEVSCGGLRSFCAAEAARLQGEEAFSRFHAALLAAVHREHHDIAAIETHLKAAEGAGLDVARFERAMGDRGLLARLAADHTLAESLGIFGTPTLVFAEGQAIFLKMSPPPPPGECLPAFMELRNLAERRGYIHEVKRPPGRTP